MSDELERKLKRERVEKCLNCEWFEECDNIGKFEECVIFREVDVFKEYVIISLKEYSKLKECVKEIEELKRLRNIEED